MGGLEFPTLVMQRNATKQFDGQPLPEEKVRQLLELVRYAPSMLNLHPWKIKVVTDSAVKAQAPFHLMEPGTGHPPLTLSRFLCSHES